MGLFLGYGYFRVRLNKTRPAAGHYGFSQTGWDSLILRTVRILELQYVHNLLKPVDGPRSLSFPNSMRILQPLWSVISRSLEEDETTNKVKFLFEFH